MQKIKPEIEKILRKVTKPGRYTGGEYGEIYKGSAEIRFVFAFPDSYEVGMSNLGMKILHGLLNSLDYVWCERVFAPWEDMGEAMKAADLPLYALESGDAVKDFDWLGFTLQYELSYTNILYMLDLAKIPALACERDESFPLLIGGGPCAYNPESVADFFDLFAIGEGEEVLVELMELYRKHKASGYKKADFLFDAAKIEGIYVPSLYTPDYDSDGKLTAFRAADGINNTITKRIIKDLDNVYFPTEPILPYIETVHDRIVPEVFRGCLRGCRFCQAGMIYRPVREKSAETLNKNARDIFKYSGYDEVSLCSLSISDYSELPELVDMLASWTDKEKINISLPSMRIDAFSEELMKKVSSVRSSTLTFAPEAGSQRMRDVINKNLTEEDIKNSVRIAFNSGKTSLKLYFMIGLPGETDEDIVAIAELAKTIVGEFYKCEGRPAGKGVEITISVATFVPKCFTPFSFEAQNTLGEIERKQILLRNNINSKKIKYNYHDSKISRLEAVFARGDRRLSKALIEAYSRGAKFDGWDEFFDYNIWEEAFAAAGIDMNVYAQREFKYDDLMPWDFIDIGVTKDFLIREHKKSKESIITPDCGTACSMCGAAKFVASENFSEFGGKLCCR